MNTVNCRYNPNHKLKLAKLPVHEEKCPDRFGKNVKQCPYNIYHKVPTNQLEKHKRECSNKPDIDPKIENELREYLSKQNVKYQPISQNGNKSKQIPGIKQKEDKIEIKKMRRIVKKSEKVDDNNFEIIDEQFSFESDNDFDIISQDSISV